MNIKIDDSYQGCEAIFEYGNKKLASYDTLELNKRAVNAIDDIVIVFYDTDEISNEKENNIVRKETFKLTHT